MRKPRDFDSELKALTDKAKQLKVRKVQQLGDLVIATGADVMDTDVLTGALLAISENKDAAKQEVWRSRGATFFQGSSRKAGKRTESNAAKDQTNAGDGALH